MTTKMWPSTGRAFDALQFDEGLEWDVEIVAFRNGRVQTSSLPGARWVASLFVPEDAVSYLDERRQLEALLVELRGGAVRIGIWNLLTPKPRGTLQTGSPLVASTMAAGATSVDMKACSGGLKRGDRFQFGATGQRVMVTGADVTPSSGNMTVAFEPQARLGAAIDSAIVYDKPYSAYILREPRLMFPYRRAELPGFTVELVEGYE
jgi:hypothetical protein